MTTLSLSYWAYAVVLLLGGLLGYLRARSNASLIAGILFAILTAIAGFLVHNDNAGGVWLGGITACIVTIFFAGRYYATKKPMPAVPIIALSILVIIFSAVSLLGHRAA